jgi:RNA polymerase sigma factor (sigma-70 family)
MSGDPGTPPAEDLLADLQWLQRLAMRLTGSGADADDLAQDTWTIALRRQRLEGDGLRGWLVLTARNLWRRRRRDRARRREDQVTPESAAPDPGPDLLLERLELLRTVADLVRALPEPYRATVLMRHFEGRTAAEIASATGVPAGTVRWRLKEGLDRLRAGLDAREPGPDRRWIALLLPARRRSTAALRRGGPFVNTLVVGAAALGLTLLVSQLRPVGGSPTGGPQPGGTAATTDRGGVQPGPARLALPALAPPGEDAEDATVEGVVRDPGGRPVAQAAVVLFPERDTTLATEPARRDRLIVQARSGGDGSFVLRGVLPGAFALTASDARHGPVERPLQVKAGARHRNNDLRLGARAVLLSGTVRDAGAGGIAGARVAAIRSPTRLGVRFGTISDERGDYRLQLPAGTWYLVAQAPGYAPSDAHVALQDPLPRDLVLRPSSTVRGRVLDGATGEVVAGATVRLDPNPVAGNGRETTSSGSGHFAFDRTDAGSYTVTAWSGARVGRVDLVAAARPATLEVTLRPGPTAAGRVLDPGGRPIEGASVQLFDGPLQVHPVRQTTTDASGRYQVEGLWTGSLFVAAEAPGRGTSRRALAGGGDLELQPEARLSATIQDRDGVPLAGAAVRLVVMSPQGDRLLTFRRTRTDAQGRVDLGSLGAGTYTLDVDGREGGSGSWQGRFAPGEKRHLSLRVPRTGPAPAPPPDDGR